MLHLGSSGLQKDLDQAGGVPGKAPPTLKSVERISKYKEVESELVTYPDNGDPLLYRCRTDKLPS